MVAQRWEMIIWLGCWTRSYPNHLENSACQPWGIDYVRSNVIETAVRYYVPALWTSDNLKRLNKEQHAQGNRGLIR